MQSLVTIIRHDLRGAFNWTHARRTVLLFSVMAAVTVVLSWPNAYTLDAARPPATLLWWGYVNTYVIGRLIITTTAHMAEREDDILPHEWSQYGMTNPLIVLAAKVVAGLLIGLTWMFLSLPIVVPAYLILPTATHIGLLHAYWIVLAICLSVWSVWFAILINTRERRFWLLNGLWLVALAGPLLTRGNWRTLSPLAVVDLMIPRAFTAPAHWTESVAYEQLLTMAPMLSIVTLIGCALALIEMVRWHRRARDASYG